MRGGRFSRIYVEITNCCNLRCDFCPGTRRAPGFLAPADFDHDSCTLRLKGPMEFVDWGLDLYAPQTTLDSVVPSGQEAPVPSGGQQEGPAVTAPEAPQEARPPETSSAQKAIPVETVLLAVWAAGAVLCLLWVVITTAAFSRRCMRWAKQPDGNTAAVLAAEQAAMGFTKPVALYLTSATTRSLP